MDDQTSHAASQRIVDALDASVRDIAKGDLHDAQSVLDEARHMLADHHRGTGSSLDDDGEAAFNANLTVIAWQRPHPSGKPTAPGDGK
jgi:hypothetical protein